MNNPKENAVVLLTHENGNREFCRISYTGGEISGSIGYNAMGGDIEKARLNLYPHLTKPVQKIIEQHIEVERGGTVQLKFPTIDPNKLPINKRFTPGENAIIIKSAPQFKHLIGKKCMILGAQGLTDHYLVTVNGIPGNWTCKASSLRKTSKETTITWDDMSDIYKPPTE